MKAQLALIAFLAGGATAFADPTPTTCPTGLQGFAATAQGSATIGGKVINYTSRTGLIQVTVNPSDFAGIPFGTAVAGSGGIPGAVATAPFSGCFFYTEYTVAQAAGAPPRPVTFAFNGGPGASSSFVHLGMFGPKRVVMGADGLTIPSPFQLEDNPDSMLDITDTVMIDPIGTGFSTPLPGTDQQAFFGAQDDAESVATFIRNYLVTNNREGSPFYIAGESYGGIRGSLVADLMQEAFSYLPKGVVFISPCFSSTVFDSASDDPFLYITYLPSMAEIANFHNQVKDQAISSLSNEALYQKTREWAMSTYLDALISGDNLAPSDSLYQSTLTGLASYTGISTDALGPNGVDLRLSDTDFFTAVVPGKVVGRFDGRFIAPVLNGQTGATAGDPSAFQISKGITPAFDWYLHNELGIQGTQSYAEGANIQYWPYNSDASEFVATNNLSRAFANDSNFHVFVGNGYYDMACPMGTAEYERSQLDRKSGGADRMQLHRYPSGHMIYTNPIALHSFKADLITFYQN